MTKRVFFVSTSEEGQRLDAFLHNRLPHISRSSLKKLILEGSVRVNGAETKPSHFVSKGEKVGLIARPRAEGEEVPPEDIPVTALYEDDQLVVVDKPSGMVVHPAAGVDSGTLVNALLYQCGTLASKGAPTRPGIVHRLDKDTSGTLVVAKTDEACEHLSRQLQERAFTREYIALACGLFEEDQGTIEAPIGRSSSDRKRMAVTGISSKEAITHFKVLERFSRFTLLELRLETGRTHQIRVHLSFIGRPIVGDKRYGRKRPWISFVSPEVGFYIVSLKGQALHAKNLGFVHPTTGKHMEFKADVPEDFQALLSCLREHES